MGNEFIMCHIVLCVSCSGECFRGCQNMALIATLIDLEIEDIDAIVNLFNTVGYCIRVCQNGVL